MLIHFWPDGCWCHPDELDQMTHKSDDYGSLELPDDTDEHQIDTLVFDEVGK